jgi:WXG100 family type VII secretion target
MAGSFLQFMRNDVSNVMSQVKKQQGSAENVLTQIKGYIPKVQAAWIGGDADEFAADVGRKLVPAMTELILAIAGINVNLTKATSTMDSADNKVKGLANKLGDIFGKI